MELKKAIEIIKDKYPYSSSDEAGEIISQMVEIIKTKTNNFSNSEGISTEAQNMRAVLQQLNIKPADWRKTGRSFQRSEQDAVIWLADHLSGNKRTIPSKDSESENVVSDDELDLLELEASALALELELYKYKKAKNKKKKK